MAALVFVLGGAVFLGAAWLWWHKVVAVNQRFFGAPRSRFQRGSEQVNRWYGTLLLAACGLVLLVCGLTLVGG
ncbi:MAG TPA: hypothetical protein VFI46_13380 [Jiangellaceae bacterium]|nr:hypothetical protein [Jiangellaceae bacterium]